MSRCVKLQTAPLYVVVGASLCVSLYYILYSILCFSSGGYGGSGSSSNVNGHVISHFDIG